MRDTSRRRTARRVDNVANVLIGTATRARLRWMRLLSRANKGEGADAVKRRLVDAGRFQFHQVKPESTEGAFPLQAVRRMGLRFHAKGVVWIHSPINEGRGTFTLSEDGKSIRFSGTSWTERDIVSVPGDDAHHSVLRRMHEAEDLLQARFSMSAGAYHIIFQSDAMVLKSQKDGTELVFKV